MVGIGRERISSLDLVKNSGSFGIDDGFVGR